MGKLKSQRHHWWPEGVSDFWKDEGGCAHQLSPDGNVLRAPPKNFGVIGNGHHIKLSSDPHQASVWDHSFEPEFQAADDNFPNVIKWLEGLDRADRLEAVGIRERFLAQDASDEQIKILVEGLVSLAVRSPMNRESAVGVAELLRGPLPKRDRNTIMGLNMRSSQKRAVESIGVRGKFVVIYSPAREFIFGDGFFHNIQSPTNHLFLPKILAPLTPRISVLFAIPQRYTTEPRLFTIVASQQEADFLNNTVQVYARNSLFYRSERPNITDSFGRGQHLIYSGVNPIEEMIHQIPGVPPRDTSLDFLRREFEKQRENV